MIHKASLLLVLLLFCSCGNDYSLCLVFDNVEGLRGNSKVMLNGMEIGKIEEMKAFPQGVYVTVSIDGDYRIPEKSAFRIYEPGLLADKLISVEYSGEKALLKDNDTIKIPGLKYNTDEHDIRTLTVDEIDTLARRWGRAIKEEMKPNDRTGKSVK